MDDTAGGGCAPAAAPAGNRRPPPAHAARIVVYQRPLEAPAADRNDLADLVRTSWSTRWRACCASTQTSSTRRTDGRTAQPAARFSRRRLALGQPAPDPEALVLAEGVLRPSPSTSRPMQMRLASLVEPPFSRKTPPGRSRRTGPAPARTARRSRRPPGRPGGSARSSSCPSDQIGGRTADADLHVPSAQDGAPKSRTEPAVRGERHRWNYTRVLRSRQATGVVITGHLGRGIRDGAQLGRSGERSSGRVRCWAAQLRGGADRHEHVCRTCRSAGQCGRRPA